MIPVLMAIPFAGVTVLLVLFGFVPHDPGSLRAASLVILAIDSCAMFYLSRRNLASPIHWGMSIFLALAAAALWIQPEGAGGLMVSHAATLVYLILLAVAVVPLLLGKEVFTTFFAKKQTPEALWGTSVFITINRHLTGVWAILFLFCSLLTLVPGVFSLHGPFYQMFFEGLLPAAIMVSIGLPVTRRYPGYYQRKLGITPPRGESHSDGAGQDTFQAAPAYSTTTSNTEEKEIERMADKDVRPAGSGAQAAKTCDELLRSMPLGFNPGTAEGLEAIYQFEVSGSESFTAHIKIAEGICTYHSGPAAKPDVIVKTPADVWLAVSKGELDGQIAFMNGKYRVDGNLTLLLRLKAMFPG
jgi:putative sterol carrier protein